MNLYETTDSRQSFHTREGKSCGLVRTKSMSWIAFLPLIILLALPTITFAQATTGGERPNRPGVRQPVTATTTTTAVEPLVLGTADQLVQIPGKLSVGNGRMEVVSSPIGGGVLTPNLYIRQLNQQASPAHLCWRVAPDGVPGLLLTPCTTSQSSLRYKTDLRPFLGGLNVVNRLKPYDFAWKTGGVREIGLIAEDVAQVEPLLTFKNGNDEIEGVKYENLNVVFINAFKEQQSQIDELRQLIKTQQELLKQQAQQIESMKKPSLP